MPDPIHIQTAVRILRSGGLVAFPTETVYGLGADATRAEAIARIYAAKGRPATNPLIVHVSGIDVARRYAADWPDLAERLAVEFWPGPLTLVLPRRGGPGGVVSQASAGGPTLALRAPDHPLALQLLRAFDGPVAAPSANRSTRVSPTTAQHVRDELGPGVDLILDGGPCRVGIESTVLDLTAAPPVILRPGGIGRERIEAVAGPVRLFAGSAEAGVAAASPGQQSVHYAPRTPAFRFERKASGALHDWLLAHADPSYVLLRISDLTDGAAAVGGGRDVLMPASPEGYAAALYATLREWDSRGLSAILVEMPPDEPAWLAVRDRLRRATQPMQQNPDS